MKTCRTCREEFAIKKIKRGFADQCDDCSEEQDEPDRYLGFNDGSLNKSTNTAIYKGSNSKIRASISNQRARTGGF